jgi:heme oxygenase
VKARQALREATAAAHSEVDAIFSRFDLRSAEGYRRFLIAQASALFPTEAALDEAGAADLVPDWQARRRSKALREDLEVLGVQRVDRVDSPTFASPEAVLGGVYVLEGSRLGAALLGREVREGTACAFLGAPQDSRRWRKLLEDLEAFLYRRDQVEAAAVAARQVFACFAEAGRRQWETAPSE